MTLQHEQKCRLGITGVSVAGAAGLAALIPTAAIAAPGEQIFSPETPYFTSGNNNSGWISWDPFSLSASSGYTFGRLSASFSGDGSSLILSPASEFSDTVRFSTDDEGSLATFSAGDTINSLVSFDTNSSASLNRWPLMITGDGSVYFGYRIGSDGSTYGWVRFDEIDGRIGLTQWAINYVDDSITIPMAIPEPSTYASIAGLFFAGVVVFSRWKRKRVAAA